MKKIILILISIPTLVFAWDGYDYNNGKFVDIEKGSLVREGNDIEIYDWSDGEYKNVEVDSFNGSEVQYTDPDSGEQVTIDMD